MEQNRTIYILSGLDKDFSLKIEETLSFLAKVNQLSYQIEIVESISKIGDTDYLILYLDELSLSQLARDNKTKNLLDSHQIDNKHVIVITDDLNYDLLPDYLMFYSHFKLFEEKLTIDENENENKNSSNFIQLIFDIIRYIKEESHKNNNSLLTIFMGPPDGETTYESHKIIRELLHHNYHIVPNIINESAKNLLSDPTYLHKLLNQSDLAIHFISHESLERYPEKISPSLNVNQQVAAFCSKNTNLALERFIYIPAENEATSEEAIIKIAQFKSDTDSLIKGELLQTPIEKLKSIILAKLQELQQEDKSVSENIVEDDIYVIYPPGVNKGNIDLITKMTSLNLNYSVSQVDLDQLELLQYHQNRLSHCRGVFIISFGNDEWLQRKISDILKSPGWGRKKPFDFKVIVGMKPSDIILERSVSNTFTYLEDISKEELKKLAN